jgi:hypothetical protein
MRFFFTYTLPRDWGVFDYSMISNKCVALTTDRGVTLPAQRMVRALLPQVIAAIEAIASYDDLIAEVESKLAARRIFRSFPGAADVFVPRLLAVFGEDRTRCTGVDVKV